MNNFKKYLYLSLMIALVNLLLVLFFFFPRYDHTDTPQYISTIKYLAGDKTAEISQFRILKPLPILIGVFLTNFTAAENTLIIQNIFFYFLFILLTYLLVYRLYQSEKQAFYGAVLVMTSYPMLAYGLASLTDLSGWFFFLVSALLGLEFLKNPNFKTASISGLVAGIGMLFKESVAAAPIFFVSLLFIASQLSFKEKSKYILVYVLSFILLPAINSVVLYKLYSYSYIDAYRLGGLHPQGANGFFIVSFPRIIIEIARTFSIGWLFVLFGAWKEFALKNVGRIKILLAFIPPSLSVFLWCYPHNRMIFIAFPILALLGSFGLLRNHNNQKTNAFLELTPLFLYVFFNYAVLEFLLRYGPILQ